jgi:hypothetical protein
VQEQQERLATATPEEMKAAAAKFLAFPALAPGDHAGGQGHLYFFFFFFLVLL